MNSGAFETWEIEARGEDLRLLKSILNRARLTFPYRSERLSKYIEVRLGRRRRKSSG